MGITLDMVSYLSQARRPLSPLEDDGGRRMKPTYHFELEFLKLFIEHGSKGFPKSDKLLDKIDTPF